MVLENGALKIVQEAGSLLAPGQGTELPKFRVFPRFCQFRRVQPSVGIRRRNVNIGGRYDQDAFRRAMRGGGDFVAPPDAQPAATLQKKRNVCPHGRPALTQSLFVSLSY